MEPHAVAIVLDIDFGERLVTLSRRMHVWIVGSLQNQPFVDRAWSESSEYSTTSGVTTFDRDGYHSEIALFSQILDTLDEHHASWTDLHIYGIEPTYEVRAALAEYGATTFVPHHDHFIATREALPLA